MKRIALLTAALSLLWTSAAFAATPEPEDGSIADFAIEATIPPEYGSIVGTYSRMIYKTRGCCSHHKGVCDCVNGRVKCCDGTFSPSCGC